MPNFQASRGGHAPGHLRGAFCDWVDEGASAQQIEIDDQSHPIDWLFGQLWNCSDIMPSEYCGVLEMRAGSTYARAVRKLRTETPASA